MSNSTTLFSTKSYAVTIGISPFVAAPEGRSETPAAYLITNTDNGVVEGEHRVIGMAIRMAKEMQELLDSELDNKEESADALPGTVVTEG